MTLVKIVAHGDNDINSNAEAVNAAMVKENPDLYCFVGDGPYSTSGTGWVAQQKKHFDDKKDKMIWSRGNHDEDESESKKTQQDMEAWFPEAKALGISDTWLMSRQVGNVYVISMDTQDLDVEFKRDQFNWVTAEIAKAKQLRSEGKIDWVVALFHKPFFTLKSSHSPYTAVRFLYKDLFKEVDFGISGHNHNTQLWYPMVPNESQANGEGQQLFTYAADGKTFDFTKEHGVLYIVSGHSAHEWNAINDSGTGVTNVMHFRDSGKFGYTSIEFNDKKAKVLSKDVDANVIFEYNVTRENDTTPEPTPPEPTPPEPTPPEPGQIVCPEDYEFDPSLNQCIPKLEPNLDKPPKCPPGYYWNKVIKQCSWDGTTPPEPDPTKEVDAEAEALIITKVGQTVVLNGSKSKGPIIKAEWMREDNSGIPIILEPSMQNWSSKFVATKEMVNKDIKYRLRVFDAKGNHNDDVTGTKVVVNDEIIPDPDPTGEIDEHGIKWLVAKVSSPKTIVEMSRDEAADDRWSGNITGLRNGFEATFIGKSTGTNDSSHFAMKQFSGNHSGSGAEKNAWYDTGLRIDGEVQLQTEYPHPNNHDFSLPDANWFIKKISKGLEGNWIGLKWCVVTMKPNGTRQDGIRLRMWVDEDPLDANNKPKNNWQLVYDFIDTGQVIPADKQLVDEQDCEVPKEVILTHMTSMEMEKL